MTKFSLDFRFVEIEREISALGDFLPTIERQVAHLIEEDRRATENEIRKDGADDNEAHDYYRIHEDNAENVFPRLVRVPLIISLWACYESAILEIAKERQKALGARLSLRNIQGDSFLERAKMYFDAVLNEVLDSRDYRLTALADLSAIRNVLAHGNGQTHAISEERLTKLQPILRRHPTVLVDDEYLRVSKEFIDQGYEAVAGSLTELIQRIRGPSYRVIEEP